MLYPVILAGGGGRRLWPLSTKSSPKQLQVLFTNKTLLRETYDRLKDSFDSSQIFVSTSVDYISAVCEQLSIDRQQIFTEPMPKGTAMAIGSAAMKLSQIDPNATVVTINSDHYIKETDQYIAAIKQAESTVAQNPDHMVLIGIKPEYPETGYGYIERGDKFGKGIYRVKSFKEKPNKATASKYVADSKHYWNPAIFVFRAGQLLQWYEQYLPEIYQLLMDMKANKLGFDDIAKRYEALKGISIDYGLLEKLPEMLLVPASFTWADIGNWRSVRDVRNMQAGLENISNTKLVTLDSRNNLLYSSSDKLIATIGINDIVLVETEDVIFICPAERAQEVKELLKKMSGTDLAKYL